MKISVIIPTYKPQGYIWECLDSLRGQTFPQEDFEVIIVLNGCKEPYWEEIERYIAHEGMANARVFQTDVPGVSNARNMGIELAKGEYITFVDDDDYVSETYLERLYGGAKRDGVMPVSNVVAFVDETGETRDSYLTQRFGKILGRGPVGQFKAKSFFSVPVAKMLGRETIGSRRFKLDLRNGEDSVFMFEVSDKVRKVEAVCGDAVYYRRIRQGSAMMAKRSREERADCIRRQMRYYTRAYCQGFPHYSFSLYLSRLMACIMQLTGILRWRNAVRRRMSRINGGGSS